MDQLNLSYLHAELHYIFTFSSYRFCLQSLLALHLVTATISAGKGYAVTSVALVAAVFLAAVEHLIRTKTIASYLHQTSWFTYTIIRRVTV